MFEIDLLKQWSVFIVRIYLDNCCYNRPYDNQSQLTIVLEAQAKLCIQNKIKCGDYELVTSETLRFEVANCPIDFRKSVINDFIEKYSSLHVGSGAASMVKNMAREIVATGVKYKDACHIASALIANCSYLISTDKRLLKYKNDRIKLVNPIEFVRETEGER